MKKGELTTTQIFTVAEIILALSIVAFLYIFAQHVLSDTTYERSVLSTDQALLIDTIQSQPLNTQLTYSAENIEKYVFCFSNKVSISEDRDSLPLSHPFFINLFANNQLAYSDNCIEYVTDNIYFSKQADHLIIENKKNTGKYICPYVEIKKDSLLLDPSKDFNNPGEQITQNQQSYQINSLIVSTLIDFLEARNTFQTIEVTRDISQEQPPEEEKQEKIQEKDITIIINTLSTTKNKDYAYIYYNGKSTNSSYLACKIANQLNIKNLPTTIIPKNILNKNQQFILLKQNPKPIVYIEIYAKQQNSIISDYPKISEAIGNALFTQI
jgi:hypothetical protein